jgi:hypothetical protein
MMRLRAVAGPALLAFAADACPFAALSSEDVEVAAWALRQRR